MRGSALHNQAGDPTHTKVWLSWQLCWKWLRSSCSVVSNEKKSLLQGYQVVKVTDPPFPQSNYMSEGSYFVRAYSTMLSAKRCADAKHFLVSSSLSFRALVRMFDPYLFRPPNFVLGAMFLLLSDLILQIWWGGYM